MNRRIDPHASQKHRHRHRAERLARLAGEHERVFGASGRKLAGTTHVLEANETSSHVMPNVSLVRAQRRMVNISARDAVVSIPASRAMNSGN
jgi:uncharacterized cupin superfamily protein